MGEPGMDFVDTQVHGKGLPGNDWKAVHISLNGGNTHVVLSGDIQIAHTNVAKIFHDLIHGKVGVLKSGKSERIVFWKCFFDSPCICIGLRYRR